MYLTDLYQPWHRGVVDPLREAHRVLETLNDQSDPGFDSTDSLAVAEYHVGEALKLLTIGTEELHTIEAAGVGAYREVQE
jgi:hypothetical protein